MAAATLFGSLSSMFRSRMPMALTIQSHRVASEQLSDGVPIGVEFQVMLELQPGCISNTSSAGRWSEPGRPWIPAFRPRRARAHSSYAETRAKSGGFFNDEATSTPITDSNWRSLACPAVQRTTRSGFAGHSAKATDSMKEHVEDSNQRTSCADMTGVASTMNW